MTTKGKQYFLDKLEPIKRRLPKKYGTIAKMIDPNVNIRDVHNVFNNGNVDWAILDLLDKVALMYESTQVRNEN